MFLKQQHKIAEKATKDIKMGWNSATNNDKEKHNTLVKITNSNMASSVICEKTGFQIQTRDISTPPPPQQRVLKNKGNQLKVHSTKKDLLSSILTRVTTFHQVLT